MSTKTKTPKAEKAPKASKGDGAPNVEKAEKAGKQRRGSDPVGPAAVNLLSPWVLEELRVVKLRKRFAVATLALVLLLGLGWTGLRLQLHRAEEEVRGEEAVSSGLSGRIADLSDVKSYVVSVEQRAKTVDAVTGAETQFSRALDALDAALPRSASLDTLTVALPTAISEASGEDQSACPGPDPFGTTRVVACIQISGTAASREDVSTFVQRLARVRLFVEPFVSTTTKGSEPGVTFTGSVGLTYAALADPNAAPAKNETETEGGAR